MPLEQKVSLPLVDNFSVDIQIRIQPRGREYQGYIQTDYSDWCSFPIQLTTQDVKDLNTELQRAIEFVSSSFETDSTDSTQHCEAISRLAQKGCFAFKKIFAKGTPRDVIHAALSRGAVIQVTSEDFFIPWELLYDGPLGDQIDASCFWGMEYIISRTLIREARPGDFMPPVIPSRPRVGLIACHELEHVLKKEIPTLQKFLQQEQIDLSCLHPLVSDQRDKGLADFGRFLSEELQMIHLACHAYQQETLSESYLLVSDGFSVSMEDFDVQEFEIEHKPFVLLNACLSGTINPLHTSNWAALFWKCGARGVLATEFHVPDWFAASFVEELYKQLLLKRPIGEALLLTRRYFWTQHKNPLGLGYALYSRPSIRIAS
jgi:hypothetical protein